MMSTMGHSLEVAIIDVSMQQESSIWWPLGVWSRYFLKKKSERSQVYNLISLEFSGTRFASKVIPPTFVREMGWVESLWPDDFKKQDFVPRVRTSFYI